MEYFKYEMSDSTWNTLKNQIYNSEFNVYTSGSVKELGHICKQYETIETEAGPTGVCVSASALFAVDIIWDNTELPDFTQHQVWPVPSGVHIFAGWEDYYKAEYNRVNNIVDIPDELIEHPSAIDHNNV